MSRDNVKSGKQQANDPKMVWIWIDFRFYILNI